MSYNEQYKAMRQSQKDKIKIILNSLNGQILQILKKQMKQTHQDNLTRLREIVIFVIFCSTFVLVLIY